ncbi:hypothetical protein BD324DRAFT_653407 [Kockovaella imperatae]|uniref:Uncharacterized protein n=1 Tax=Kockovaella imperatae TaxID=4999 RepID=A0A1Y1U7W6_9TREE|nr:hypothetical protein BD324DRAFT_653407 [Kockovaella imperatae]ORX34131.1 hypothetical protein BD324DRAFT_653407 [Kockovaella imperatae]
MSEGIFYLDEERGGETRGSRSPSPQLPSSTARETRSAPHHATTHTSSSADKAQQQSISSLQIPNSLPNLVSPVPQPFTPSIARKHTAPFAATPSFPSPLAQAITVPSHSDTSSSSSHSDEENDQDRLALPDSPTHSGGSKTPRKAGDLVLRPRTTSPRRPLSPASTRRTTPPQTASSSSSAPKPFQAITPSSMLSKGQRGASLGYAGSSAPVPSINTATRTVSPLSTKRVSPVQGSRVSETTGSPTSPPGSSRRRSSTASGSSSLGVPGSSSLSTSPLPIAAPNDATASRLDSVRRRSVGSNHSPSRSSKDTTSNVLGLGWGTSWETGSSGSSSYKDKGKAKDISGPPSPKISKADPLGSYPQR